MNFNLINAHQGDNVTNITTDVVSADASSGDHVILEYTYLMVEPLVGVWTCTAVNVLGDSASENITLKYFSKAAVSLSDSVERNNRCVFRKYLFFY